MSGEELLELVQHGKIEEATMALVNGADPNFQDPETGNTALHLAVSVKKESLMEQEEDLEKVKETLVKLMIVFDADLTIKNRQNKTALELAGANDIAKDIKTILDLQKETSNLKPNGTQSDEQIPEAAALDQAQNEADEEFFLLSLDGGGIRGLVFTQVLVEMEKYRKQFYPKEKPLLSKFNWMAGTSAGGLSALALAGNNDVNKLFKLFFNLAGIPKGAISSSPHGGDKYAKKFYDNIYNKQSQQSQQSQQSPVMTDIKDRKVTIMTTLCKQSPLQLHIMSNYGGVRIEGTEPPDKQLIWKAARATSSVPFLDRPENGEYIDGGAMANNPTTDTIIDMFDYYATKVAHKKLKLKLVLSLGCGLNPTKKIDASDFAPQNINMSLLELLRRDFNIVETFIATITQPNGEVLKCAEFVSKQVGAQFVRINPPIPNIYYLTHNIFDLIEMLYCAYEYMMKGEGLQQTLTVLSSMYGPSPILNIPSPGSGPIIASSELSPDPVTM